MKSTTKTCAWTILLGLLVALVIVVGSRTTVFADVAVGDFIDSNNWQKAQGLLPDAMLDFLKKGYYTIKVGKLNYEPGDILSDEMKESLKNNLGKYDINAKGEKYEVKTGEVDPYHIIGVPFPNIDATNDPKASSKMHENHMYLYHNHGNMIGSSTDIFVGKKMERQITGPNTVMYFAGNKENIEQQNQVKLMGGGKIAAALLFKVTDPYELNGLATLGWWYDDATPDKTFAYVPALRRVRVMTAAARSDAMFGTDYSLDDISGGFAGKVRDFNCKVLRTQDALMRFNGPEVIKMIKHPDGSYTMNKNYPEYKWGFETPGWKGKPFVTTNQIWVKRTLHVFECTAKDPYYNYGKFELWYDPKTFCYAHKIVWDRAGKIWKVMNSGSASYKADDGALAGTIAAFGDWIYDVQRDHATSIDEFSYKQTKIYRCKLSADSFSQIGLTKFAK